MHIHLSTLTYNTGALYKHTSNYKITQHTFLSMFPRYWSTNIEGLIDRAIRSQTIRKYRFFLLSLKWNSYVSHIEIYWCVKARKTGCRPKRALLSVIILVFCIMRYIWPVYLWSIIPLVQYIFKPVYGWCLS